MKFKKLSNKLFSGVAVAVILLLCLTGCVSKSDYKKLEKRVSALEQQLENDGSSATNETKNSSAKSTSAPDSSDKKFDSKEISEDIDIQEYDFVDNDGNKFSFFIFDNKSDFDVTAKIKVVCKDNDDKELDESSKTVEGIPKGKNSFVSFALNKNTETVVRTVSYEQYNDKINPLDSVTAKATKAQGGANLSITNNGSNTADDLKYLTLFFKGSNLVGFDSDELPDISAASTETASSECYEDFDTIKVYLSIDD